MPTIKLSFPEKIAYRILSWNDIDNITLRRRVARFASLVPQGAHLLDAGAGLKPYERYFSHCKYESCDFAHSSEFYSNLDDGRRNNISARHTFVCSIHEIPVEAGTYDFVMCTQVLEHVPDPPLVLKEFHRILKPGGQLFLTVPQGYGVHGEPYNFFYFTKFGLELLLKQANFDMFAIEERGGYFFYLYDRLANSIPRIVIGYRKTRLLMMALLSPLHIALAYLLGPVLLLLEPLDREKRFTLGYVCVAKKS